MSKMSIGCDLFNRRMLLFRRVESSGRQVLDPKKLPLLQHTFESFVSHSTLGENLTPELWQMAIEDQLWRPKFTALEEFKK